MLRTPLKNSKNVDKPFKSPFESPASKKVNTNEIGQKHLITQSPLSINKNLEVKRVLVLDENQKVKRRKTEEGLQIAQTEIDFESDITKKDLQCLKRQVFELRQELDRLKSRERCTKKNNPKDLKLSISQWKTACQNALEILCSELTERNGQSTSIPEILKMLNIPSNIVGYSEKDDGFL